MKPEELEPTFASNLRLLRERNGWSQRHLADLMDTKAPTIVNWEKGYHSPTLSTVRKLCEVFGVTPNVMLGEETSAILATSEA